MHPWRQHRSYRRMLELAALLVAGALLIGGARGTGTMRRGRPNEPPSEASGFTTWTWLPGDRAIWERIRAALRTQLDDGAWMAARAAGRAMPLEQAIAEALEEHDGRASHPHADSGHENGSATDPTLPGT